jgi:hypothetical protein
LIEVQQLPQVAIYDDARSAMAQYYQGRILSGITPDEAEEWRAAVTEAEARRAFMLGALHHCAIGTKP